MVTTESSSRLEKEDNFESGAIWCRIPPAPRMAAASTGVAVGDSEPRVPLPRTELERKVWNAANEIEQSGQAPTYERVRNHLGHGSNTTIGKYLATYASRQRMSQTLSNAIEI